MENIRIVIISDASKKPEEENLQKFFEIRLLRKKITKATDRRRKSFIL